MVKKAENLPELVRKRKGAAVFWCVQGDAAAEVGAETTVDGGGGAPEAERREEDDAKRHGGKRWKWPLGPIYKAKWKMASAGIEESKKWIS